jgi:transcriptional regulator with XRE-family HTH domain
MKKSGGLGNYVAERRKELALTQSDLAKSLGYTVQGISKFESGDSQISILVLPKLANLLNESIDDLLAEKKNPEPLSTPNPQVDNANLVANLIALRSQHNYSQEKEAALLGVSKRSIINYEQGEGFLPLEALKKLLKIYKISAKAFYFDKISPLNVNQIHYPNPKKGLNFLWLGLAIFAGVGLIVGCTSPLWLPKAQQRNSETSSSSAGTTPSSSSNTSSASSASSGSSSSTSSSSSSSSVDQNPDLSPYIPGLKELFVQTADGIAGAATLTPGSTVLTFFSGSFQFTKENQDQYAFEFTLGEMDPGGAKLVPDAGTYGQAILTIFDTTADMSALSVGIQAYAVGHEDQKVEGTSLTIHVFNSSSSADLSSDFPGLKAITLTADGVEQKADLEPGSHPLGVLSTPANYFTEHSTTLSIQLLTNHDGVTLANNVLTIASYVSDKLSSSYRIVLTSSTGKNYTDESFKYSVVNPTGEPDSDVFPGILSGDITINGSHNATLSPGDTTADVSLLTSSRCPLELVPGDFLFNCFQSNQTIPLIGASTTGNDLKKCILTVPAGMPDGALITLNISLLRISKSVNLALTSLYLTISNPSTASSSSNT